MAGNYCILGRNLLYSRPESILFRPRMKYFPAEKAPHARQNCDIEHSRITLQSMPMRVKLCPKKDGAIS